MNTEYFCCGKLMRHTALGYYECEICKQTILDDLGIIKETLKENPNLNAFQLIKKTGLPNQTVLHYINNGTLTPTRKEPKLKGYYVPKEVEPRWRTDIYKRRR